MVTRDSDALLIEKWAATGDVATPESQGLSRDTGWGSSYSTPGGDVPEREVFNQMFRELTALAVELNTHGLLVWNGAISYVHPTMVFGSDNLAYASVRDNMGVDPTTDTNDDDWTRFGVTTSVQTFDGGAIVSGVVGIGFLPTFPLNKVTGAAPLASPSFTGDPTSITRAAGDNDTSIATTAFVQTAVAGVAFDDPALTGDPTSTTPSPGDNDTSIATTAFVQAEIADFQPITIHTSQTDYDNAASNDNTVHMLAV